MPITGLLTADFSSFETAVKKAEVSLKGMEGGAGKVQAALGNMTERAAPPLNSFRDSVSQVDQMLAASGVNVGKYARAVGEISDMSGKTVGQLGALATGASIFSAAMAGWQFGTWIAGITGLDKAVEKYADSLTNLPAEVAGAKQDTINRAIAQGAAATISYTDAIQFNIAAMAARTKTTGAAAAATDAATPPIEAQTRALSAAEQAWNASAAAADKAAESNVIYGDGLPPVIAEERSLLEVLRGIIDAQTPLQSGLVFTSGVIAEMGATTDAAAGQFRNLAGEMEKLEDFQKRQLAGGTMSVGAPSSIERGNIANQFRTAGDTEGQALERALEALAAKEGTYAPKDNRAYFAMLKEQEMLASLRTLKGSGTVPGFGATVNNTFNIVDTEANIARRVSEHITQSVMRGVAI